MHLDRRSEYVTTAHANIAGKSGNATTAFFGFNRTPIYQLVGLAEIVSRSDYCISIA
jgi:hypothetical protein